MRRYSIAQVVRMLLAMCLVLTSCRYQASDASSGQNANPDAELTILFTGDVLLDRGVRPIAEREGVEHILSGVSPLFREADAVVINLECPLTDTLSPVNKKYIFRADAKWAKDLHEAGVTHAAMANNHTNDQGRRGLQATSQHLAASGITPMGYGCSIEEQLAPVLVEKDGISVAMFNAIMLPIENWCRIDGKPGISQPSADELVHAIAEYKSCHSGYVVAVLHWGTEFQSTPDIRQRSLAHRLVEAGTDVIIGHHPHVLQPVDTIGSSCVFYSLGNFVFDQHPPQTRRSMIARVRFGSDGTFKADTLSVSIEGNRPVLIR